MIDKLILNMTTKTMKDNFLALDNKTKQKEFCKLLDEKIELQQEIKRQSKAQCILDDEITELQTKIDNAIEEINYMITNADITEISAIKLKQILGDKEDE